MLVRQSNPLAEQNVSLANASKPCCLGCRQYGLALFQQHCLRLKQCYQTVIEYRKGMENTHFRRIVHPFIKAKLKDASVKHSSSDRTESRDRALCNPVSRKAH